MRTATRAHSGITAFELQLPDDLTALSDEDLDGLLTQATEQFDGLLDEAGEAPSPEQISAMETLRDQILAVRAEHKPTTNCASERQTGTMAKQPKIDKDAAKVLREAKRQGFEIRYSAKGHAQVYRDGQRVTTLAGTGSDHRGLQNAISQMRRAGFQWPPKG